MIHYAAFIIERFSFYLLITDLLSVIMTAYNDAIVQTYIVNTQRPPLCRVFSKQILVLWDRLWCTLMITGNPTKCSYLDLINLSEILFGIRHGRWHYYTLHMYLHVKQLHHIAGQQALLEIQWPRDEFITVVEKRYSSITLWKKNAQTPCLFQPRLCYFYETEQEHLWSVSQLCFTFAHWLFAFIHEIKLYEYIHVYICAWMYVHI